MSGLTHEEKLREMNRAFIPFSLRLTLITQADGLGWYKGAPLALSFAGAIGTFPGRIAVQLGGAGPFMRLPGNRAWFKASVGQNKRQ